ncbi:AAA family ATPase [Psychrobacter sp. I-STPA10]|uniref:AAA family ATPase n=1 Tax=Psychrobacter sp. I-STPA10 TaxID=2585769 RepID=UPI001E59162D|nr:AAA family ATPase [Psychrobacter sp. I-STPA10]
MSSKKHTSEQTTAQLSEQTAQQQQRPPAEVRYANELQRLQEYDQTQQKTQPRPTPQGWQMSMLAVRDFILGNASLDIEKKLVCPASMIERILVTLASQRALLLIGEPGTAKSMLSELLATAISGNSTLTVQGSAATSEDQIRYGWNYGLLLNEGPSTKALVASPVMRAMQEGKIVRFEEITRCPPEVQDGLLSILSERLLMVPELAHNDEHATIYAKAGFNLIATANTRDKGVNEMSAALKRRFAFETVFPIAHIDDEMSLVKRQVKQLLTEQGIDTAPSDEVIKILVTMCRELRTGIKTSGNAIEKLSTTLSTAEVVNVAQAVCLHGYFLRGDAGSPADILNAMLGCAIKDNNDDKLKLRRYLDHHAKQRPESGWQDLYQSRLELLG